LRQKRKAAKLGSLARFGSLALAALTGFSLPER
jgi:hypothetical protein